ncbi:MAG: hypothetical protein JJE04_20580 [Acidobacteriia bacterium]|nr:hypothetical protein [Terriglobia bacterium]
MDRKAMAWMILSPALLCAQLDKLGEQLGQLGNKVPLTQIKLVADPADARLRPLETIVIQVQAFGKPADQTVRLQRAGARLQIKPAGLGWLSKPFVFQGKDEEKFYEESVNSIINIFRQQSGAFVNKDSFLYTAPQQPGKYTIEAELDGQKASIEITVAANAPSRKKAETSSFEPERRARDAYRPLAEYYAPFLAQETWYQPKSDMPARFDFDRDWDGGNNWDHMEEGSSQAYVYYAAMETSTHWFLIYNVFHPRDYSDKCAAATCHENDNEGIILTVRKDGSQFGRLQVMETLAHNNVYSMTADNQVRSGAHNIDGPVEFYDESHPAVFIESGGHGIYGTRTEHSRYQFANDEFTAGTGITLIYKGVAERPLHANHRLVGYDLLPILDHWWPKAEQGQWNENTFDEYFQYQPAGGRPALPFAIGGSFYGRNQAANKAKPFWGWHDTQTLKKGLLAVGQWGLDPAYGVTRNLRMPGEFSLDYVYNPYLLIGERPEAQAPEPAVAPSVEPQTGAVEIELRVDDVVEVQIAWDQVYAQTISGQEAAQVKSVFSAPVPPVALQTMTLKKLDGRGEVTLWQHAEAGNGFTTIVRIEDSKGGADNYRFQLVWAR